MIEITLTVLVLIVLIKWASANDTADYNLRGWNHTVQMWKEEDREKREFQRLNVEQMLELAQVKLEIRKQQQLITNLRKRLSIATKLNRSKPLNLP